jgi:phage-related protein
MPGSPTPLDAGIIAQKGDRHPSASVLKGFHGASVLEIIEDLQGDTYRAVYTVRYSGAVWVVHCFQKKSKHGIATPPRDLEVIRRRLSDIENPYGRGKR